MGFFHALLGKNRSEIVGPAPERPVYLVGDVHGRADLLGRIIARIKAEAEPHAAVVFLGDYIDRGPQSREVLMQLRAVSREAGAVCLMGNHERMLLDFLDRPVEEGRRWLRNGGIETLQSFGVAGAAQAVAPDDMLALNAAFRAHLEPSLEDWLRAMPLQWQSGTLHAAHAGMDPARTPDQQEARDLLWGAPHFMARARRDGIWVAHGHVVVAQAGCTGARIAVDTGAHATGMLTAARVLPGGAVSFLTA